MRLLLAPFIHLAILTNASWAHFIWVTVDAVDGQPVAQVFFAEEPSAGEPYLIDKIGHSELWLRAADGKTTPVKAAKSAEQDAACLESKLATLPEGAVELHCDYGVYKDMLLQYHAKHLRGDDAAKLAKVARSEKLPLDIVPSLADGSLRLQVLWQGEPVAHSEVTIVTPDGNHEELTTDKQGVVTIAKPEGGRYGVLASYSETDKSGERKGASYNEVAHYTTLTLALPEAEEAKVAAPKAVDAQAGEPSASEVLAQARAGRAVWEDFPGMTADAVVTVDGKQFAGKLKISPAGTIKWRPEGDKAAAAPAQKWLQRNLGSLVMHRMPDGSLGDEAEYVDEDRVHPLGRLIKLKYDGMGSIYRIRDGVVRQVNRNDEQTRFTITVLEVARNAEQKYLPRHFTMSMWNPDTGELLSSSHAIHEFERVGKFDLPVKLTEIRSGKDSYGAYQVEFSNLRLNTP